MFCVVKNSLHLNYGIFQCFCNNCHITKYDNKVLDFISDFNENVESLSINFGEQPMF